MKDKTPEEILRDRLRAEGLDRILMRDAHGVTFDPSWHVTDKATGKPKMNKDGTFRRRPQKPICTVDIGPPPGFESGK